MKRTIVDANSMENMINREHVLGYLHALEELTVEISASISRIELSDSKVKFYHDCLVDCIDTLRIKAARDLGRYELTNNTLWMDD